MKKILIVDDLKLFLEQEKNILMRSDFKIFTATSGKEALDIHRSEQVDLILIDLDMPEMAGDELCSLIRNESSMKRVSIIMVTSSRKEHIERCVKCGANAYVLRPINRLNLTEAVSRYLEVPPRQGMRVLVKAVIKGSFKNEPFFGVTSNISITGMLFATEKMLARGDVINCSFFVPDGDRIVTDGEVMRIAKKTMEGCQYGIKFINVDKDTQKIIEGFVSKKNLPSA